MIISGGENIYPAEVESAVYGHPHVAEVAVIGVPDDTWGEAVKAVVALKPGAPRIRPTSSPSPRTASPASRRPRPSTSSKALPRNASGKILRRELREPVLGGRIEARILSVVSLHHRLISI
jgi:long-chain acyl-CoA synthetase